MTIPDSRTLLIVLGWIGCNVAGDLMLSHGMRQIGPVTGFHPTGLLRFLQQVAATPPVLVGTALEAVAYGTFLALLSGADLSVVVPAGAGTYIHHHRAVVALGAARGGPAQRWMGVFLVTVGVALVLSSRDARSAAAAGPASAGVAAATAHPEAYSPGQLPGRSPG
jgi:hypothetical protein